MEIFFSVEDPWNGQPDKVFVTEKEARSLLRGLDIIKFDATVRENKIADGTIKKWHLFEFIAKNSNNKEEG